jgi:hypothetical protein
LVWEKEVNTPQFKYSVRLPFASRQVIPDLLGSKFLATLDALTQIDSNIFPDWEVGDLPAMKGYPLAAARPRIAEIIGHNVIRDDLGRPEPESGYTVVAHTAIISRSRRMTFRARTWLGDIRLNAGDEMTAPDPEIVTFPLFRAALSSINAIWQQPWACAQAFRSRSVNIPTGTGGYELKRLPMIPAEPTFPVSIFHVPWFAYLSAPLAKDLTLPPEIQTERTADGSVLMIATEERLDPDIAEHVRRARVIAETMIACTGRKPREMPDAENVTT